MKKLLCLLAFPFLIGMSTFAVDIKTQTVSDTLIQYADQAIAKGTSVDTLITAMKTIHEQQKSDLAAALAQNNLTATQTTLNQRNEMYPLTNHLYDIKAGSGKTITNASGVSYTFKKQAALPWLNISRGNEAYYSFPQYDSFLEFQRTFPQTGMLYQEINITSGTQTYFPHYFYGGENTLNDLTWKSEGLRIREITDKNADLYFFFDVPTSLVETKQFSLGLTSGATLSGKDIFTTTSYSPEYFLTSLDEGLQFCQKVAAFIGSGTATKEYPAQHCSDAAAMKFYKGMHEDILKYAADLYLK